MNAPMVFKGEHLWAVEGTPGADNQVQVNLQVLTAMMDFSEERERVTLGAIVDNVSEGIITIGEDGLIRSFNGACARLFGYAPEEVAGRPLKMLMPAGLSVMYTESPFSTLRRARVSLGRMMPAELPMAMILVVVGI